MHAHTKGATCCQPPLAAKPAISTPTGVHTTTPAMRANMTPAAAQVLLLV
jgi:hypothetical protein